MKEFTSQTGGRYTYIDDIMNLQNLALTLLSADVKYQVQVLVLDMSISMVKYVIAQEHLESLNGLCICMRTTRLNVCLMLIPEIKLDEIYTDVLYHPMYQ